MNILNKPIKLLLIAMLWLPLCIPLMAQDEEQAEEPEEEILYNKEDNAICLKCHGNQYFEEYNEELDETLLRKMPRGLIIDSVGYYKSNHRTFMCTDCHSWDYNEYPHSALLHFEMLPACLDCHGGDETYEKYNFEGIEEEYLKSTHANLPEGTFSCWSCHDPHNFLMEVRTVENIDDVVKHDNSMCLSCHGNPIVADYYLGSGLQLIMGKHEWLPETENHFRHVRCIECHTEIVDNVLVQHHITPKEEAVRRCAECHTTDSRLLQSLYKYVLQQQRIEKGFVNGVISGQSYVIGATKNLFINRAGVILILLVLAGVAFHTFMRIIIKK